MVLHAHNEVKAEVHKDEDIATTWGMLQKKNNFKTGFLLCWIAWSNHERQII